MKDNHVLNHYEYDVWGNLTVCEETVENRFKYNGQQFDPISQQYYLRARYYKPVIGRFTQEDTYRGDGLNLYAYCRNNPVFYIDPSGHMCEKGVDRVTGEINTRTATKDDVKNLSSHIREKLRNGGNLTDQERNVAKQLGIDVDKKSGSKAQGVGNPVKVAGKGNTGRTIPNTLNEQMAMHQVMSNPLDNAIDMSQLNKRPIIMTDPRWSASDGWIKMSNNVNGIEIHFVHNKITGAFDDFKFK